MLDPTVKELNIRRSVKKFFVDNITEYPLYFDRIITSDPGVKDSDGAWISIALGGINNRHVSQCTLSLYTFTIKDPEGIKNAQVRDKIIEVMFPGFIDLYDTDSHPWKKIGAMKIQFLPQEDTSFARDQSRMSAVTCFLKWGTVW